jgi:hypothetical protein
MVQYACWLVWESAVHYERIRRRYPIPAVAYQMFIEASILFIRIWLRGGVASLEIYAG